MKSIFIGGVLGSFLAVIFVGKHVSNTILDAIVLIFGFIVGSYIGYKVESK